MCTGVAVRTELRLGGEGALKGKEGGDCLQDSVLGVLIKGFTNLPPPAFCSAWDSRLKRFFCLGWGTALPRRGDTPGRWGAAGLGTTLC